MLCFADDFFIITGQLSELDIITTAFVDILLEVDLKINSAKSKILVKDTFRLNSLPPTIKLGNIFFETTTIFKYLGTIICSDIGRKEVLKPRCQTTMGISRSLLPKLQSLKLPCDVLKLIYTTVILPNMIYSLRTCAMTKANRRTLMHREAYIVTQLASIATPSVKGKTLSNLLENRSVNKRIRNLRIRFYWHIMRRPLTSLTRCAVRYRPQGKRKHGRPIHTYHKTLSEDFTYYPHTRAEWEQNSLDKNKIKTMTTTLYATSDDEF